MRLLPPYLVCMLPLLVAPTASGSITITGTWNGSSTIQDNNDIGLTTTVTLLAPADQSIEAVTVQLEIEGGWNGDLYGYLVHDGKLTMLMNRPGRTLANPDGAASTGMIVTFSDAAALDIHTGLPDSGMPEGFFQPDGRLTDPQDTLDTDARPARLAVFNNADPNGEWQLFLADQGPGETSTLQSWTLAVTAVPEPSPAAIAALTVMVLVSSRRRRLAVAPRP